MSASLVLVGICSFLFHASLRQTAQFSDDLSMLFLAGSLLQRLYCAGQLPSRVGFITTVIYLTISVMSAIYIRSGNLLVHSFMFVAMLQLIWPRTIYLINRQRRSSTEKDQHFSKFKKACTYLALAVLVWIIDLEMCQQLRSLRNALGLPWAWVLELHGWWHIFTAVGATIFMELIRDLCP